MTAPTLQNRQAEFAAPVDATDSASPTTGAGRSCPLRYRYGASALAHDALQGNVEAEFGSADDDAGCGCAYPESVDAGVVARSNLIHAALKATAARQPAALAQIQALPMFRRYRVGSTTVGVVHGDAESLAG